ncbi:MAG: hypothetical protein QCH31_07470 [Methanolobus sp.]|nr:hypothetical protein [Methanolobus sp.]
MTREDRSNAAVSETLGYILLFGIVTLSMGTIYAIGYPALQSNIDANIFESAEQNFIVLQSNMDRVAFDQTPVKVLKLKLQSSAIAVNNESSMTIDWGGASQTVTGEGEIQFQKDSKTLTYEMGAVFKKYPREGTVIVSKPPIYTSRINNQDIVTIGLVSVNGNSYIAGKGIATLTLGHNSSNMEMTDTLTNVTVAINSSHATKWAEYLEDIGFDIGPSSTATSVTAYKNDTMLILSRHVVDVDIS